MTALVGIILSYMIILTIGKTVKKLTIGVYAVVWIVALLTVGIMVWYLYTMPAPEM